MQMTQRCMKCGHVAEIEYSDAAACPQCGAIYSKMQALTEPPVVPPSRSSRIEPSLTTGTGAVTNPPSASRVPSRPDEDFVQRLRAQSTYPTFRGFVQVFYVLGLVFAACLLVGGVVGMFISSNLMSAVAGVVSALVVFLFSRLFKETWLMLADLSDATIHLARRDGR